MVSFRTGTVDCVLDTRHGLQRVEVDGEPAYVLTDLIGAVAPGDRVVVNTTAVDLGLGTGGWHVVHWNLERSEYRKPGPGHIMKLRYTSLQVDVGAADEMLSGDESSMTGDLDEMPVVVVGLHSMVPLVAAGVRLTRPAARIGYLMTDDGALPLALSDLVASLRQARMIDVTLTAGHAFGGDLEVTTVAAGLWHARHSAHCDVLIVGMGPGNVGTGARLGSTALNQIGAIDMAVRLGGRPVFALRASLVDDRERHRGISHHSRTVLELVGEPVTVPVPAGHADALIPQVRSANADAKIAVVEPPAVVETLAAVGIDVASMGRRVSEDPLFVAAAASAGRAAAELP